MKKKDEPQFTLRRAVTQPVLAHLLRNGASLSLLKLSVALDEFFCASPGKAYRNAAIFVVAFDANDGADSIAWMADSSAEHGICVASAFGGRAHERIGTCRPASRCRGFLFTAHATKKFLGRIRIFRIGLVATRFANLGQRAAHRVYEVAGNFRQETRGQGSAQLLFVAKDAAVDGTRERQGLARPRHAYVNETALFFDAFLF